MTQENIIKKAVVLISGGLDSSTVLAMVSKQGYHIHALSFDYAQNHSIETEIVKEFIKDYEIKEHRIIKLDLSAFNTSALVNKDIKIPTYSNVGELGTNIPVTYVPARNTIFLSYALGFAEVIGARDIFIGAHITDSANYPDCRAEYLESFESMANLAIKSAIEGEKIKIHALLIKMSKAQIVAQGLELGVDYSKTISCYNPTDEGLSCGRCQTCLVRLGAFEANGQTDPILYVK